MSCRRTIGYNRKTSCTWKPGEKIEDILDDITMAAIEHCQDNLQQAAELLGTSRMTMYRRLRKIQTSKKQWVSLPEDAV